MNAATIATEGEAAATKTAFVDEKFATVRQALTTRKWGFVCEKDKNSCELIFTNLRNVDFASPTLNLKIVNHLKGSNHLSNKVRALHELWMKRSWSFYGAYDAAIYL